MLVLNAVVNFCSFLFFKSILVNKINPYLGGTQSCLLLNEMLHSAPGIGLGQVLPVPGVPPAAQQDHLHAAGRGAAVARSHSDAEL